MDSPVFLLGAERSGTTLLRLMLDGHPQLAWPCEFDFALDWPAARPREWPDLIDYWSALAESPQARQLRLLIRAELDFPQLVRSLLDQLRTRTHKPTLGVAAHGHFERILELWPDARFIYLVRDGRDVARSLVASGRAGNVWAAASVWRDAERGWRRLCAELPAERHIELRYEELVREPQRELSRVCSFLGVAYSPALLDYPARTTHAGPDANRPERWREQLTARELAWLERAIGRELRERAYAPSPVRAAWLPAPRRLALRAGDRLARVRFRLQRYAACMRTEHQVARRFRFATLFRITVQRLRAIDASYPK